MALGRGATSPSRSTASRGTTLTVHPAQPLKPRGRIDTRGWIGSKGALAIPLDRLTPDPAQPRKEFDEGAIMDLAASLKEQGQLQLGPRPLG